jgi:hypothetical protein
LTETQGKQLLILTARADYLGGLRERKRISDEEYFLRLNELRQQVGLEPLITHRAPGGVPVLTAAWGT